MGTVRVSGNFRRYNAVNNRRHITGARAAEAVLRAHRVFDVGIRMCQGHLTDHYDPQDNTIYLSEEVYNAPTIAAVGVAAHRGLAMCRAVRGTLQARAAADGHHPYHAAGVQPLSMILLLIRAVFVQSDACFCFGIILFSFTTFFQLVTLPVEFNASHRAIETIGGSGLLDEDEALRCPRSCGPPALTYVAALLMSLVQLLRFVLSFWLGAATAGTGEEV